MSTKKITITVLGPNESLLKSMPKVDPLTKSEFKVLVDHLHHSGDKNNVLTEKQVAALYEMGDGYGPMDIHTLCELELMWDWSHIRDSSPNAQRAIFEMINFMMEGK